MTNNPHNRTKYVFFVNGDVLYYSLPTDSEAHEVAEKLTLIYNNHCMFAKIRDVTEVSLYAVECKTWIPWIVTCATTIDSRRVSFQITVHAARNCDAKHNARKLISSEVEIVDVKPDLPEIRYYP